MFEHPQPPESESPRREGVPDIIDAPPPDIPVVPPPDIPPADLPDRPRPQRDPRPAVDLVSRQPRSVTIVSTAAATRSRPDVSPYAPTTCAPIGRPSVVVAARQRDGRVAGDVEGLRASQHDVAHRFLGRRRSDTVGTPIFGAGIASRRQEQAVAPFERGIHLAPISTSRHASARA